VADLQIGSFLSSPGSADLPIGYFLLDPCSAALSPGVREFRRLDTSTHITYTIKITRKYMRLAKSFTIEPEINEYVDETKGDRSASERVNELLRRAMLQEQYDRLEAEAAAFFSDTNTDRAEARAFQKASLRSFGRD
jgi:hypothetical protein